MGIPSLCTTRRAATTIERTKENNEAVTVGESFSQSIATDPPSDDVFFVDYLIAKHLDRGDSLGLVEGLMASFVRACDLANNEIEGHADSNRSRRLGTTWGSWIRKLRSIATENNLDSGPGQNVVGYEPTRRTTPFAVLVWVLQQSLPEGYERHQHSKAAFIQALHRALREEI